MKKASKNINKGLIVMTKGERAAVISLLSVITVLMAFSVFRPAIKVSSKEERAFHNLDSLIALQERTARQRQLEQQEEKPVVVAPPAQANKHATLRSESLSKTPSPSSQTSPSQSSSSYSHKPIPMLDLNVADSLTLVELPQIGEVMASRIHRYRNRLGGFVSINQLLEVKGMDSARFEAVRPYVKLENEGITALNVNRDEFKTLLRHPYLEYDQVKAIVNQRERKGLIKDWDQLRGLVGEVNPLLESYIDY